MNMKCMRCNCEKFYLDVDAQKVSCSSCGFYFDMKMLVPDSATQKEQEASEPEAMSVLLDKLDSNHSGDFEIIGGVLTAYKGKDVDVVVPEGVLEIGVRTFMKMTQIRSVCLPESLKIIRREAFWGCTNLQRINIPGSVELIEDSVIRLHDRDDEGYVHVSQYRKSRCFWGCVNLAEIIYDRDTLSPYPFQGTLYFQNQKAALIEREKTMIKDGKCPKCGNKINRFFKYCKDCDINWNPLVSKQWGVTRLDIYIDYSLQGDYWI